MIGLPRDGRPPRARSALRLGLASLALAAVAGSCGFGRQGLGSSSPTYAPVARDGRPGWSPLLRAAEAEGDAIYLEFAERRARRKYGQRRQPARRVAFVVDMAAKNCKPTRLQTSTPRSPYSLKLEGQTLRFWGDDGRVQTMELPDVSQWKEVIDLQPAPLAVLVAAHPHDRDHRAILVNFATATWLPLGTWWDGRVSLTSGQGGVARIRDRTETVESYGPQRARPVRAALGYLIDALVMATGQESIGAGREAGDGRRQAARIQPAELAILDPGFRMKRVLLDGPADRFYRVVGWAGDRVILENRSPGPAADAIIDRALAPEVRGPRWDLVVVRADGEKERVSLIGLCESRP